MLFLSTVPSPAEIYTLSLHDALPIYRTAPRGLHLDAGQLPQFLNFCQDVGRHRQQFQAQAARLPYHRQDAGPRSEEHTSELQSRENLVCRLLLEKKKIKITLAQK